MVELIGFEPTTLCLQSRCSSQLSYSPGAFERSEPQGFHDSETATMFGTTSLGGP